MKNQPMELKVIAHIRNDFPTKFGLPRQSGLVEEIRGRIVFEKEYRNPDALRGMEGFSHLWLIWGFSEAVREQWSPTVRPPRLGGNRRVGVFATRSPFRPNAIGLSCVEIESIEPESPEGPIIHIKGADMMDGTPIYDIKPYIPYADCHPEATDGFTAENNDHRLTVEIPQSLQGALSPEKLEALRGVLARDPRPAYHDDPERVYGLPYAGVDVRFRVSGTSLTVTEIVPSQEKKQS